MRLRGLDGVHFRCDQKNCWAHGRFAENFWYFIQHRGIRNDLDLIWKYFSFGKIRNLKKNIAWDYSEGFGKTPISGFQV